MARLYEVAKELNVSSAELMSRLTSMGIEVKSNFQQIEPGLIDRLKNDGGKRAASVVAPEAPAQTMVKEADPETETPPIEQPAVEPSKPELPTVTFRAGGTVKDFADLAGKPPAEIIKRLIALGEMLTINQPISLEAAQLLGEELGFDVELAAAEGLPELEEEEPEGTPEHRAPVVTVMGHVDHGKTSLLDAIRETDVIGKEAGGITQHIGAYQVVHNHHRLTFIDTPGHEAFTAMRARGAQVTDVAVLVVAADDGVKAQTIEALNHAKAAGVPIVVAINKIDKPEADLDRVKRELSELGLVPEEWGGDTVMVEVSAKKRLNLEDLLEMIHLVSEIQELKAPRDVPARGVVIEAKLTKGRGPVATVLVQKGALKVGDIVVAGAAIGRVRAMMDDKGRPLRKGVPAQPVEVLGLATPPAAGDEFAVVNEERKARQIVEERQMRAEVIRRGAAPTTRDLLARIGEEELAELRLIIKADVQGSLEALRDALGKIEREEVRTKIIHAGVGAITETDVMLAEASQAIVIGFNVRPDQKAREMADRDEVDIRLHRIIYQVVDDMKAATRGLLKPQIEEEEIGRVEVRETFRVPRIGVVAGCYVTDGEVNRGSLVRLVRDGTVVYDGRIGSLRRFKEDVTNVKAGFECGIGLEGFSDIKIGDVLEAYRKKEVPRE